MLNTSQGSPGSHLHSVDRFTSLNRKFHLFSIVVLPAASSKLELVERACVSPSSICHKDVRGIITTLKVMRAKFVKGGGRGGAYTVCISLSPRAHPHVVGMLRFMSQT